MENPLAHDLDHILARTSGLWEELRDQRIFITGGTGFFGRWLLESFAWANDKFELGSSALVLTRNPHVLEQWAPHLAQHRAIQLCAGDVRSFTFPSGQFSHIIHAATETNVKLDNPSALKMYDTSTEGTRRVLEFARVCGTSKFLLTSSGAVYGEQPADMENIAEDYLGAPMTTATAMAYGHGKRAAEFLCAAYAKEYGLETKIARCFAFVGPYLPMNSGFAIGNFIRDAMQGGPIRVNGDGTPYRSYLYAADLAYWLWTILFKGKSCKPYNVGSEVAITIGELAMTVAEYFPGTEVQISKKAAPGKQAERYIPSTQRAQGELGLERTVELTDAIKRTVDWYSIVGQSVDTCM
jgi:nucleoside-diphosphate-sugar epimerase